MSQDNVELVRRMVEAFNRDEVESVVAAFSVACEIDEPADMPDRPPGGFRGHDGIREWMRNLRDVADISFVPRAFTTSDDLVLCELDSTGLGRVSGAPMSWTTFAVFHLRDGKIDRIRVFLDRDEAVEASGLRG